MAPTLEQKMRRRRRTAKLRRRGEYQLIDATAAREHLRALLANGMTRANIALASGVSSSSVGQILGTTSRPEQRRVHRDTAAAVLAVHGMAPVPHGYVPVIGTLRRIQALRAANWPHTELSARWGHSTEHITAGTRTWVQAALANSMRELYNQLGDRLGPSGIAGARARSAGCLPPIWWDEDKMDDPNYEPETKWVRRGGRAFSEILDEVAVLEAMRGRPPDGLTLAERDEAIRRLHDQGLTDGEVGGPLGMSNDAVLKARWRMNDERTADLVLVDDAALPRPQRVHLLHRRGMEIAQIAKRLGVERRLVARDLRRQP